MKQIFLFLITSLAIVAFALVSTKAINASSKYTIAGVVYDDKNNDGMQGLAEPGLSQKTVVVYNLKTRNRTAMTITNSQGLFIVANLNQGAYQIVVRAGEKYVPSHGYQSVNLSNNATNAYLEFGFSSLLINDGLK